MYIKSAHIFGQKAWTKDVLCTRQKASKEISLSMILIENYKHDSETLQLKACDQELAMESEWEARLVDDTTKTWHMRA